MNHLREFKNQVIYHQPVFVDGDDAVSDPAEVVFIDQVGGENQNENYQNTQDLFFCEKGHRLFYFAVDWFLC